MSQTEAVSQKMIHTSHKGTDGHNIQNDLTHDIISPVHKAADIIKGLCSKVNDNTTAACRIEFQMDSFHNIGITPNNDGLDWELYGFFV